MRASLSEHASYLLPAVSTNPFTFNLQPKGTQHARTHLVSILRGDVEGFCNRQGIKCSPWVALSRPTTLRSFFNPLGNQNLSSVEELDQGNLQASRMALVRCLVLALGEVFVVEQPSSSLLWRHPRLQWASNLVSVKASIHMLIQKANKVHCHCM